MAIDWTKPIEMVDGRKCRYLGEVRRSDQCTRAVVVDPCDSDEYIVYLNDAGQAPYWKVPSVRNAPAEHVRHMVVVGSGPGCVIYLQSSESDARKLVAKYGDCTATVKITWKDGDGL